MIVTVVWATPEVQDIVPVELPPGATRRRRGARFGLVAHYGLDAARLAVRRLGARAEADTVLADGDRVEIVAARSTPIPRPRGRAGARQGAAGKAPSRRARTA